MKEGEEYFQETNYHNFPTHAMILKGSWKDEGYGDVWCKITDVHLRSKFFAFALQHPKRGGFAWADQDDCKFGVKKKFRTTK